MQNLRLTILAVALTGCTANNTLLVNVPVTATATVQTTVASNTLEVAAPVTASAVVNTTVASNTVKLDAPVAIAAPVVVAPAAPVVIVAQPSAGGGGAGGGGGGAAPPPPPPPAPALPPPAPVVPTPEPTPRPTTYAGSTVEEATAAASNLAMADTSHSSGNGVSYAQTFKVSRSGNLKALALYVLAGGTLFNIAIQAVDGQKRPVAPDLGTTELLGRQMYTPTGTFDPNDVWPSVQPAIVYFDPPVPVVAGTTYAWVATPTEGSMHPKWVGTKADTYPDGGGFTRLTSQWRPNSDWDGVAQDYNFEVFLEDEVDSEAAASGTVAATVDNSYTAEE